MTTDFFRKNRYIQPLVGAVAVLFTFATLLYAYALTSVKTVDVYKYFHFLVCTSTHIEASTHQVSFDGGAGYALRYGERAYVAYNVYMRDTDGERALEAVSLQGEEVEVLSVGVEKLYLKTAKEKKNAQTIFEGMKLLYAYIRLLSEEIARLDNGATQESSKRVLRELSRQLYYAAREYKEDFSGLSSVCGAFANGLEEESTDVVFSRDLRYLLCETCIAYVRLGEKFSL